VTIATCPESSMSDLPYVAVVRPAGLRS
jgi:hypothetical protein